jgi:hypothetical protein
MYTIRFQRDGISRSQRMFTSGLYHWGSACIKAYRAAAISDRGNIGPRRSTAKHAIVERDRISSRMYLRGKKADAR